MSIATVERPRTTFHIKRGLRFSHCYFIRAVHSAPEKVAFAPVKFSRCFGRCFQSAFRLALCARTVCAVVHRFSALPALHGFHRARAHRSARYTRSDTAPTFGVHVRGAIPDACPRNAVRGDYDYSQGGRLTEFDRPSHRAECVTVKRLTAQAGYRALRRGCCLGRPSWSVSIVHLGASHVNPFFKKIFEPFFFKDNENARARRGSQNRRKQVKTRVLSTEKFLEKIRKSAQKRFFRRAARQHRAPIDRGTADRVHQKRRSIENYMV